MWGFAQWAKRNPLSLANAMRGAELNESDKLIFDRSEIQAIFERDFPEAYRQNGRGSAYDATIPAAWPIPLGDITAKIFIWHAAQDQLVGHMPVYIAKQLRYSELKIVPDQGHLWVLDNIPVILDYLLSQSGGKN